MAEADEEEKQQQIGPEAAEEAADGEEEMEIDDVQSGISSVSSGLETPESFEIKKVGEAVDGSDLKTGLETPESVDIRKKALYQVLKQEAVREEGGVEAEVVRHRWGRDCSARRSSTSSQRATLRQWTKSEKTLGVWTLAVRRVGRGWKSRSTRRRWRRWTRGC